LDGDPVGRRVQGGKRRVGVVPGEKKRVGDARPEGKRGLYEKGGGGGGCFIDVEEEKKKEGTMRPVFGERKKRAEYQGENIQGQMRDPVERKKGGIAERKKVACVVGGKEEEVCTVAHIARGKRWGGGGLGGGVGGGGTDGGALDKRKKKLVAVEKGKKRGTFSIGLRCRANLMEFLISWPREREKFLGSSPISFFVRV